MMRRWLLWKVEVTRVELVFVLFVLFMFHCSCYKEEESGDDRHFDSLHVFSDCISCGSSF